MEKFNPSIAKTSGFFKPIVTTSLALALGFSVAVAQPTITTTPTNGGFSGITWILDSDGAYKPQQGGTDISTLFLSFNSSASDTTTTESNNGYAIKASSDATGLTLTSTSTIKVGSLEMRAGKYLTTANDKTVTLDLSGVSNGYALIGDLKAGGASGNNNIATLGGLGLQGSVTIDGSAGIQLTFTQAGGGITGNVTISGIDSENTFTFNGDNASIGSEATKSTITVSAGNTTITGLTTLHGNIIRTDGNNSNGIITFDTKTNMIGNITRNGGLGSPSVGDLTVNFKAGSTLQGNIQTGVLGNGNDYSSNQVTFSGTTNVTDIVMKGDIISYGTGVGNNTTPDNGNHITFTNGSMQGNVTAHEQSGRGGYNTITFPAPCRREESSPEAS